MLVKTDAVEVRQARGRAREAEHANVAPRQECGGPEAALAVARAPITVVGAVDRLAVTAVGAVVVGDDQGYWPCGEEPQPCDGGVHDAVRRGGAATRFDKAVCVVVCT